MRPTFASLPPPPLTTTPLAGEAASGQARLVTTSCEKITSEEVEGRIKAMRADVDASFKDWHDAQPECWRQDREDYLERKAMESGSGGWGRGHGGSGVGYGMGSASFGSVGHGSGAAGPMVSGRISSSHASRVPATAKSASGTNNQIASVDEADIVKTDGRYVYFAANGALRIAEALDPKIVSVTKLGGDVRELFVEGDRAVVYVASAGAAKRCTYGYDCQFSGDGSSTRIVVLDLGDRTAPKTVREIGLSGSLIAARRIGNAVHTVTSDNDKPGPAYPVNPPAFETCGTAEQAVRAQFAKLKIDNEAIIRAKSTSFPVMRDQGVDKPLCEGVLRTALRDGQAFTSVVSFDLTQDRVAPTTATIQSRPGSVFASRDALYFSVVHQRPANGAGWYGNRYASLREASEVHKFKIGDSPRSTRYVGSGVVPGHVLNQFSMDEWSGYLRIATSRGRVPDPNVESAVSILAEAADGNLVRVGAVEKIAPGEDIRAVRFDDDRGYVVTFKKTDPLFVLDLYQPAHPKILGELKIPGFSTYIHRIDPEHLLSIGFDADDHGSFAYFDGVILQLFDVKNPTEPRLVHKEKIGSRGSTSEAATNHLAFNYFADQGLLAVPMTICDGGGDGRQGTLAFSGLIVFDVDLEKGFTRLGGVDHGTKGVDCGTWWSNASTTVKRSVFLDDLVYSVAGDRVKVQRMGHLGTDIADLSLTP